MVGNDPSGSGKFYQENLRLFYRVAAPKSIVAIHKRDNNLLLFHESSCSADLLHDARRDLKEMGAGHIPLCDISSMTYNKIDSGSKEQRFTDGVLFSTYSSLSAESRGAGGKKKTKRFDQIASWFGRGAGIDGKRADYDGLLVFGKGMDVPFAG